MAAAAARAQSLDPLGDLLSQVTKSTPLDSPTIAHATSHPLSAADERLFRQAIEQARRTDINGARATIGSIGDPLARKTATWVLVDSCADSLGFFDVDAARRDLAGWPRANKRQAAAERLVEAAGKTPQQVVDWFAGAEPLTPQGAMALASAYRGLGRTAAATALIKHWWRDKSFEAEAQRTMLARFGDVLTAEDHARRADILLYGSHGPAAREMIALLPEDQRAQAQARIALRADARDAADLVANLGGERSQAPGVAFERAAYLRRKGQDAAAIEEVRYFPHEVATLDQGDRIWDERHRLVLSALRAGDIKAAYAAAADSGLTQGADAADAEFTAGWIALTKLNQPEKAERHFAAVERIGTSPITKGRALYWEGRAAEARHDREAARDFYSRASQNYSTFYGMLAAEKLGQRLSLPSDPILTPEIQARFEARGEIQATRLLFDYGQRDLFRTFVLGLDDVLPTAEDEAMLVDLARNYGEQDISMRAARGAAARLHPAAAGVPRAQCAGRRRGTGPGAGHHAAGEQFRPQPAFRRRRAGHDAADADHREDPGAADGRLLLARPARRAGVQHAAGLDLSGPAGQPVLRLLCDGHRRLQRRAGAAGPVVVVLRRSARRGHRPGGLHRMHPVLGDPQPT